MSQDCLSSIKDSHQNIVSSEFDLFSSHTYTSVYNFRPNEYFSEFHFFELFDANKKYDKDKFKKKYGNHDESTYEYCLYKINVRETNEDLKYVVANEVLSEEQRKELAKYCQCEYHTTSWFNPFKYITCQCCVGCLDSPFPRQYIIDKSRKYRDKIQNKDHL